MLYMAVYTDAGDLNAVGELERHAAFHQVLSNASSWGAIMRSVYTDAPAQTMYFLFETEHSEHIATIFQPILGFGELETVQVIDRLAL